MRGGGVEGGARRPPGRQRERRGGWGQFLFFFSVPRVLLSHLLFIYAPRSCNQATHALAVKGCKCAQNDPILWECTPDGAEDLMASDLAETLK